LRDPELISEFVAQSLEHLEDVEPLLLDMEKRGLASSEAMNEMFRAVHSIKGAAGFLGLEAIQELSDGMESLFMGLRDEDLVFRKAMVNPLLAGVDELRILLRDLRDDENSNADAPHALVRELERLRSGDASTADLDPELIAACQVQLDRGHHLVVIPVPDAQRARRALLSRVARFGEVVREDAPVQGRAVVASPLEADLLAEALGLEPADAADFAPAGLAARAEPALDADSLSLLMAELPRELPEELPVEGADRRAETVRVNISLLDRLMDLAGELVLVRNQLRQRLGQIEERGARTLFQNVDRVTGELQEHIMSARMQPMRGLLGRLPRLVRDLAQRLGKQVDLELGGGEVELDRSILQALADPMTHLLRNSLDHGIESADERRAAGKWERGRIRVHARHERGRVVIEVGDDGRGVDAARVREAAVARGVVSRAAAGALSDAEALSLVFEPGLSTSDEITDLSGRGVGLDVVKTRIAELGGQVELETSSARGSTFTIHLPLTLAILRSLVVSVADERLALPQVSLVEVVGLREDERQVEVIGGASVLRLRGNLLPLVNLRAMLGLPPDPTLETSVVVLRSGADRYGLVVDDLHDGEEIVVKPLPSYLASCGWYAGTTILGDGRVAMILDAAGLARAASLRFGEARVGAGAEARPEPARETRSVVLFRNGADEQFALPLDQLHRLEQVSPDRVEQVGDRAFVQYAGLPLPLVRLEDVLPVGAPEEPTDRFYVLIPRLEGRRAGILARRIVDTLETDAVPDPSRLAGGGVLGSAIVEGRMTLFLDAERLLDEAGLGRTG